MGNDIFNRRKFSLLTSTALTRQAATFSALGLAFSASSAFALDPNALPVDPNVVGGAATFNQSGATLTVNQSTNRTVIDWRSFDIGSNATTNFVQPNSSSIAVNRVNGSANPTEIQGTLNANGQVWILNPNGVLFGKNAKIDVAGIVASTGNINVQSFMSGDTRLQLSGADGGSVTNEGAITIADGGLAAFVAPAVRNSGVIQARVGKVTLAAGTTFTLDLAGDQLVEIGLGANNALVDQSGQLIAEGSTVNLTAKSASAVVDSVVNVSGTVLASGVHEDGGAIVLTADNVTTTGDAVLRADGGTNGNGGAITAYANKSGSYDGTFSAKGGTEGGNGGAIETSGKKVEIASTISVNTLAPKGETGNWTIDPDDLTVTDGANAGPVDPDASTITNGTVVNQLLTTGVTLAANNSITVDGEIISTGAGDLALNDQNADGDLTINLNATIKLGAGKTLSGQGSVVNVANSGSIQNGVDVAKAGGATVNVAAGTYDENVTINKSDLSLLSTDGRDATKIVGQGSSALGTVLIASGANNVTLGSIDHGFEIVGIDNASAGIESAAVYFKGANSGSTVAGNRITANGDHGLMTEYNAAVTNLTVDGNIFDGQTFAGATAGDLGFANQFTAANVPRQLVVISGGSSVTNTKDIAFTNNQVTGTAGGLNGSGQEQGNTLVTIDAVGATITGNTFAGTTTRYGDALRARGTNTEVSHNTFDGANMGSGTNMLNLANSALTGTFADVLANNRWINGSVWLDHAVANVNYVFRGIQSAVAAASVDDTVHIGAGTYTPGISINTAGLTLAGEDGAKIVVPSVDQTNAIDVWANNVTIKGLEIAGPAANESYLTYAWGSIVTRGIAIHNGATNFTIADNYIHGLRNNVLIDGRNTGSVTNNIIDNSKSGISVQYTDAGAGNSEGYAIDISGNSEGEYGNEWGMNTHLNGHYVGATYYNNSQKIAADAPLSVQQALLAASAANGGWTVQDQAYSNSNRTAVVVSTSGSNTNQGSALGTLQTIEAGVKAVVAGGTVYLKDGTYVVDSANGYSYGYLAINKSLNLVGESEAGTIIDAHGASSYGLRVIGGTSDVNLSDFTLYGVVASGGYGIKVEDSQNVNITNVTSKGAYKAQIDLNGVRGGTLDNVTADGTPSAWGSGSTKGAAIAITDSQNVLVKNSSTNGGSYGGLAIYQSNKPSGYSYQVDNVTIAASNTYGEANPVYMEDESAINNFGAVTVEGFDYIARNTNPADAYTWFQKTQQGAIDVAALAAGYVEGWLGSAGNNVFTVGYNTAGTIALSINNAINAASNGATINVLAGTYGAFGTSFGGASDVSIRGYDAIIDGTGLTGRIIDLRADGTTLTGFTINGNGSGVGVSISGRDVTVADNTINGTLTGVQTTTQYAAGNATISRNTIDTAYGISLQNTGNTVSENNVTASAEGVGLLKGANTFTDNIFDIGASGNAMVLYGAASANDLNAARNTVNVAGGALQGAVNLAGTDGYLNLAAGNYTLASTLGIRNSGLTLAGASRDTTIIDGQGVSGYGIDVTADDVTLSEFTFYGPAADTGASYGIKVQPASGLASDRVHNFTIRNVTSRGAGRAELDLNSAVNATIDGFIADGRKVGSEVGTKGAGIQITDSDGVTIRNGSTIGNLWGGVALYQKNAYYDQQTTNISVEANNDFTELNPLFMQDESASKDFGTLDLQGYSFAVANANGRADGLGGQFTWLQKTQQAAIDFALGADGMLNTSSSTVQGWDGSARTNTYTVGTNGVQAMSVNAAINAATTGAMVNLLSGVYDEAVTVNKGLTLQGADADDRASLTKGITLSGNISDVSLKNLDVKNLGAASGSFIIRASGTINGFSMDNVSVDGQNDAGLHGVGGSSILGDISITNSEFKNIGNWAVFDNSSGGSGRNVTSFVFTHNIVDNVKGGITVRQVDGGIGSITIENNTVRNIGDSTQSSGGIFKIFNAGTVNFAGNTISDIGTNASVSSDGVNYGAALLVRGVDTLNVTDNSFTNVHMAVAVEKGKAAPGQTTFTGNAFDNNGYVFFMPGDALDGGNVTFGTGNEITSGADTVQYIVWRNSNALDLTGVQFNGKLGSQMTDAELFATEDLITHGADLASSGLATVKAGNVYVTTGSGSVQRGIDKAASGDTVNVAAGSYAEDVVVDDARNIAFNGSTLDSLTTNVATAIGGSVTAAGGFLLNAATTLLSDTVLNGAVTAGAIDGTTAGGQSLAINGGSGAVTLGNLGATTRLGAVSVTGTGMTTFDGNSYVANSLHFGGPATLTKALTTFDTSAAGGDITFSGPIFGTADSAQSVAFLAGTGTGGANGDISIQNAGTDSIWLGSVTVRGDDFSGATVYVGGDYNSLLTGDQTFTTDTLHTKGSVTSTVGGDATGPIVSGGNVGVNAGGNFSGNVTAPTAEIHGKTITGTFNGGTLTLFADNGVDVIANVTALNVTSPSGNIDGSFSTINTGGSGPLIVNGQTRTGNSATDPNQIVVEGFTLPAGTIITPSGEIILPSGMMIGLVSPAAGGSAQGGKPKVILVHSVQKLGELLAQGYVAIIVDLSGNKDEEQEIALAQ